MKYIKITIIGVVISGMLFSVGTIIIKGISSHISMNHNMVSNSKNSVNHSAEHNVTNVNGQVASTLSTEDTNSINNVKSDETVKNSVQNSDGVPDDVVFVRYTVRENDTLWKIADAYMPEYNAYPEEDKEGVIAFIIKENNLEKGEDGEHIIYSGQSLTIPKQKNIVLDTNTYKSNTVVKSTNKANTENQINQSNSINSSSNSKNENNNVDANTSGLINEPSQVEQTNHSNHTNHN